LKQTQADVKNAWNTVEAQKISAKQSTQEITAWNIQNRTISEKIEIFEGLLLDKKTKQESYEREERMQFGIKLHELNSSYTKNYEKRIRPVKRPLRRLRKLSYPS